MSSDNNLTCIFDEFAHQGIKFCFSLPFRVISVVMPDKSIRQMWKQAFLAVT
jgi:hypothetical protein